MEKCVYCGHDILKGAGRCPFCRKDLTQSPNSEIPDQTLKGPPRYLYRWHIVPKDQAKTEGVDKEEKATGTAAELINALTSGLLSERDWAIETILSQQINITHELIAALDNFALVGREHIATILGRLRSREASETLIKALNSPERSLRFASAWALYRIGNLEAVPALIYSLNTSDAQLRRYITYVLGAMGDRQATPHLIRMLRDANTEVRRQAILSLACLEGSSAVKAIKSMRKDAEPHIRKTAVEALALLRAPRNWSGFFVIIGVVVVFFLASLGIWLTKKIHRQKNPSLPYLIEMTPEKSKASPKVR